MLVVQSACAVSGKFEAMETQMLNQTKLELGRNA